MDEAALETTKLYESMLAFNYEDDERAKLMRDVWAPTPFMINVNFGSGDEMAYREAVLWCDEHFGPESSPIHGHVGTWHRGNATVFGWEWWGFSTRELMDQFIAAFPKYEVSEDAR